MNPISDILKDIVDRAAEANPRKDGDYIGENGLLMCGKCHTPKECIAPFGGENKKFPCICACENKRIEEERLAMKRQQEMNYIAKLKKDSLMDDKFAFSTFANTEETPDNKRQLAICKRYAEKFGELLEKNQGLLLYGSVGTGKTHLACCIGNALMDRMYPVFATSLVKIVQRSRNAKGDDDEEAFLRRMNTAKLLILDDLGAERSTEYALEIVYNVIDSRYRSGKPMIVTTNLSMNEMQRATDIRYRRIYDRIFEVCYPVEFTGTSWRMQEAASRYDEMAKFLEE